MEKFKEGDIVYHKATRKRGVLSTKYDSGGWIIVWEDDKSGHLYETELWTEEEYNKQVRPK